MIRAEKPVAVSEYILKRSAKMRAKLLFQIFEGERITEVEVDSDDPEKAPNIVCFTERSDGIHIACFKKETESTPMRNCPSNRWGRYCSHVDAAIRELVHGNEDSADSG